MSKRWTEAKVQRYVDDQIEESLTLDYKAAGALGRNNDKRDDITKTVSSMANSAGGTVIYGLREYKDRDKRHLAEAIDPIDRNEFSREWLEQIINNIRPRIDGVVIHPVSLSTSTNDVVYVVEIPQSHTAHQATDFIYYKRYNFQSVPMADYEVRDVMNRLTTPDADVEFNFRRGMTVSDMRVYTLMPIVKNLGNHVIDNFKLVFKFPQFMAYDPHLQPRRENVFMRSEEHNYVVSYQSRGVLFPLEERNIGDEMTWNYQANEAIYAKLRQLELQKTPAIIAWTLYADNMPPKEGAVELQKMHDY